MANRLQSSTSPYLLQHAHNPVDWHPWDAEALAQAKALDRPIFLSIGYSACHWCHVMERESFEDPVTAAVLNAHFVCIKVDREERPDLDDLYMDAVQALTGRGGWPMSVWLTPDLEPFYGGTYFPIQARHGLPGFRELLEAIAEAWRERRPKVLAQARQLAEGLAKAAEMRPGPGLPDPAILDRALADLRHRYDGAWGGFTPAPKFPAQHAVELILRRGTGTDLAMARRTLDAMWEGGMFDHLGGGFARYSVDGRWLVPHFEKMLYDNAQLASTYLAGFQALREPRYADIARDTLDYLLRDMRDPSGGFHSAEDADSEGEEGRFYVWTPAQIEEVLGAEAEAFSRAYGVTAAGNFEGANVLHRFSADPAQGVDEAGLAACRERLRVFREGRVRPAKDDKVLAAWNGLALSAFARGARILGEARFLTAARELGAFLLTVLWEDGILYRVYRHGVRHTPGFLEDYTAVAAGLVDLHEADGDPRWLLGAQALVEAMRERFEDPEEGGFFSTGAGAPDLLFRQKPFQDGVIPSGNTLAAGVLLRLSHHLDRSDLALSAQRTLACAEPMMARVPGAFLALLGVLEGHVRPLRSLVLAGESADPALEAFRRALAGVWAPDLALSQGPEAPELPLRRGRSAVGGVRAYLCEGGTCRAPIATPDLLVRALEGGGQA